MGGFTVHATDTLAFLGQSMLNVSNNNEGHNPFLNDWTCSSFFLALFAIILGAVLLRYHVRKWVMGHLKILALLIWIAGVGLYCVGFDDGDCKDLGIRGASPLEC